MRSKVVEYGTHNETRDTHSMYSVGNIHVDRIKNERCLAACCSLVAWRVEHFMLPYEKKNNFLYVRRFV